MRGSKFAKEITGKRKTVVVLGDSYSHGECFLFLTH